MTLSCGARGGVISRVLFASFGQPVGSCGSAVEHESCHDGVVSRVRVERACVGKQECQVEAQGSVMGTCEGGAVERRWMAAEVECSENAESLSVSTGIPIGAETTVVFPSIAAANMSITANGHTVWANGAFVPGTAGVLSGTADATKHTVSLRTSSGAFTFVSSGTSAPATLCAHGASNETLTLECPATTTISRIEFASYGLPSDCSVLSSRRHPRVHAAAARNAFERHCLGRSSCRVVPAKDIFVSGPLFESTESLSAVVRAICA